MLELAAGCVDLVNKSLLLIHGPVTIQKPCALVCVRVLLVVGFAEGIIRTRTALHPFQPILSLPPTATTTYTPYLPTCHHGLQRCCILYYTLHAHTHYNSGCPLRSADTKIPNPTPPYLTLPYLTYLRKGRHLARRPSRPAQLPEEAAFGGLALRELPLYLRYVGW